MIYNIQAMRAFAALSVVYAHLAYTSAVPFKAGVYGVDVFFVVSGFIMPFITQTSPKRFFLRRLIRIVPFYWSITLVLFAVVHLAPEIFHSTQASPELLFRSLFFLPYDPARIVGPVVGLGWTLNYEVYFYFIFAGALAINAARAPLIAGTWLVVLLLVFRALGDAAGSFAFYGNTIVLEFLFGIACFYIWKAMDRAPPGKAALPKPALVGLLFVSLAALPAGEWLTVIQDGPRWLLMGLPAFALVLSALVLERQNSLVVTNLIVRAVGNSSYVLYLVHIYFITAMLRLLANVAFEQWKPVLIPLLIGASAGVAVLLHRYYERPLIGALRRALLRPMARQVNADVVSVRIE